MRGWLVGAAALVVVAAVVAALLLDEPPAGVGPSPTDPTSESPDVVRSQPTEPGGTLSPCPVEDAPELTVVTFNIHFGRTRDGRLDLAQVADELRSWRADVVLLQEVDRGRWRSKRVAQARWLGRELGMEAVFGGNRRVPPGTSGNAVLSRLPVVSSHNHPLPSREGLIPRGVLRVTVDLDGHPVDVFATHLDHASRAARREQAGAVADLVSRSSRPVVLGGDLNSEPRRRPVRLLVRSGLADSWLGSERGGYTAPTANPRRRIDYLLTGPALVPVETAVVTSRVSDHRAVRAELMLVPPPCR